MFWLDGFGFLRSAEPNSFFSLFLYPIFLYHHSEHNMLRSEFYYTEFDQHSECFILKTSSLEAN